jgi:hypothetical protein
MILNKLHIAKILSFILTGLFVFPCLMFSQPGKNELNTFVGFMMNSEIDEGLPIKGLDYSKWLNAYFSIGGGVVLLGCFCL